MASLFESPMGLKVCLSIAARIIVVQPAFVYLMLMAVGDTARITLVFYKTVSNRRTNDVVHKRVHLKFWLDFVQAGVDCSFCKRQTAMYRL